MGGAGRGSGLSAEKEGLVASEHDGVDWKWTSALGTWWSIVRQLESIGEVLDEV